MSKENIFFPNTTQVPNFVFDVLMAKCASHPARLFILLAIIRKTYGWQKHEDLLSLSQIMELTGKDKKTVKTCLKFWQKEKVIQLVSKGSGRKISKYRCLLYDYIDTERVRNDSLEGSPLPLRESTITPLEGSPLPPQKQLNQLTKTNIQNAPTLSQQLKELAEKNGLTYSINTREQNLFQNKLSMEMGLTNDKILEQANRFFEIVKRDQKQVWIHSFSFGFKFLQFNWDKIDAWHNANKSNVVKFIQPTEKKAPAKFSDNDLDSLKEFLA
jgi:hypothetical protein